MKKVIEYQVIMNDCLHLIDIEVNKAIIKGWQPFGGICTSNTIYNNDNLYQAMVKYEEKDD